MCVCVCIRIFFEYFIFGTRLRGRWKGWNSRNGNIAFSTLAWDKVRKSVEGAVRGKSVEGRDAIVDALRERERERVIRERWPVSFGEALRCSVRWRAQRGVNLMFIRRSIRTLSHPLAFVPIPRFINFFFAPPPPVNLSPQLSCFVARLSWLATFNSLFSFTRN